MSEETEDQSGTYARFYVSSEAQPGDRPWPSCSEFRALPTQGLNLGLLHCRQILYHLATKDLSLLQGIFPTQGLNPGLLDCRSVFVLMCTLRETVC